MKRLCAAAVMCLWAWGAAGQEKTPTIAEKTAGLAKLPGYLPVYSDERHGRLWLEVSRFGTEFLYVESLPGGLGSNDVGLDRGQLGQSRVVRFERHGPKVLLVQPNYEFRALSPSADERRAVADSFAQSVLWGFPVAAESDGAALVDVTDFCLRDAHGVVPRLKSMKQGSYRLEATRSVLALERTKNFPKNTEIEAVLTYVGEEPGHSVASVTPTPEAITLRQHHSFVQLPDDGYRPRVFNPNAGYFGISYMDFATPIAEPIVKQFIARHRLRKKDPTAAVSEPVEPIRYYLDRGAPEPIRSALLEGARWWGQAFEAAGFRDAFRVELLPEGADLQDVRYNVIQWVHRSTRGWSYGASVTDPRTGEIIKGQVTLGSLRVRQDYLIAEGLLAPYETGKPVPQAMAKMALARLRQLAAHEVGHTLGLQHNFAASTHARASVMDYPGPLVGLTESGAPDLSQAYATGIGEWDKAAITYGYGEFAPEKEAAAIDEVLRQAHGRGLVFLTDQDARPAGSASPINHLWDNGGNAVDELNRVMKVRASALARFGERNIQVGQPYSRLDEVLVPLYLGHRYQVEAASKVLGGLDYTYATRGDGQIVTRTVPAAEQRRALEALLATVAPEALTLPEPVLRLLPPHAVGYPRGRETFPARTGLTFDPLAAAESGAELTIGQIVHPERAARLVEYGARGGLGWGEVLDRVLQTTWFGPAPSGLEGGVAERVRQVVLTHMMRLAADDGAAPEARAIAFAKLQELRGKLGAASSASAAFAAWQIAQFERDPKAFPVPKPIEVPPGQPIGCEP